MMANRQDRIWTVCRSCGGRASAAHTMLGDYPHDMGWRHLRDEDWRSRPHVVVPEPAAVRMLAAAITAYWWRIWFRPKKAAA